MMCLIEGCARSKGQFSHYCSFHKRALQRHGHPAQKGVTKEDLKPHLKRVRRRIQANAESPLWAISEARWRALIDGCEGNLEAYRDGKASVRWHRQAYAALVKLAAEVDAKEVIETVAALYLLQDFDPRKFRSDEAFLVQLSRRVLRLSGINAGSYWNGATGRVHRVYRDLPLRTSLAIGRCLAETLGVVGLRIAKLERQEAEAKAQARHEFKEALEALK